MNTNLVAKHLSYLRKQHGFTQEELAQRLQISRQAVSHWECGESMPDIAVLLELSKLYEISMNEILEPKGIAGKLKSFEDIYKLTVKEAEVIRTSVSMEIIVKAYMATAPGNARWMEEHMREIDFPLEKSKIGRVRISEVEDAQNEILNVVNLFLY